ncbi:MAG TPA: hypothetical protein VMF31_03020 [Solirubrobacterales bacterium]|nr:hypothetical protein [Solirubrobacterales bacterium]
MTAETGITARATEKRDELLLSRKAFSDGNAKRIGEIDKLGKILSSFGVLVIGGVGLAKFSDVFPYESRWYVIVLMFAGFAMMLTGASLGAWRLHRSIRPSVMRSSIRRIPDTSVRESETIRAIYSDLLTSTDSANMSAFEARAARLDRVSERIPAAAEELRSQAAVIDAERSLAFMQARNAVLSARTRAAIKAAGACTIIFLIGLGTVVITIDWMEADRAAVAKAAEEKKAASAPAPKETQAEIEQRTKAEKGELNVDKLCAENAAAGIYPPGAVPKFCLPPEPGLTEWLQKKLPLLAPLLGSG